MATLEPTHVQVAGNGAVYVAPEGTALPADLAVPPAAWLNVGYVGEDGVQFTFSRDTEDINAWQSADPIRVLTTSEPKTIEFELLEFDRVAIELAFRGGSWSGGPAPFVYTPPAAGASDVRAMLIDGIDGAEAWRFAFPRVQLSGDVTFALQRTDAVRLAMEFGVLASATPWQLIGSADGFDVTTLMAAASLSTHAELDAAAEAAGHTWSSSSLTVAEKQAELGALAVPA
jgi:hypothetical protein